MDQEFYAGKMIKLNEEQKKVIDVNYRALQQLDSGLWKLLKMGRTIKKELHESLEEMFPQLKEFEYAYHYEDGEISISQTRKK